MNIQDDLANLCRNIRILREKQHLTQKEMAAIMGVGVGMLRRIEHGELPRRCHAGHLIALSQHFGIALDVLFFDDLEEYL